MSYRQLFKLLLYFSCISLVFTRTTSADLIDKKVLTQNGFIAATLDFESLSSATNQIQSELFNVKNLVPGGLVASTLRIRNSTSSSYKYSLSYQKDSEESEYCQNLNLNVIKNSQNVYSGSLSHFSVTNYEMSSNGQDDWVFLLSLNSSLRQDLVTSECSFLFLIRATSGNYDQKTGFKKEWLLSNLVSGNN